MISTIALGGYTLSAQLILIDPSVDGIKLERRHTVSYPLLHTIVIPERTYDRAPSLAMEPWRPESLPIFCKAEYYIQKKSKIAFRFRLGSVDYVDALEGK